VNFNKWISFIIFSVLIMSGCAKGPNHPPVVNTEDAALVYVYGKTGLTSNLNKKVGISVNNQYHTNMQPGGYTYMLLAEGTHNLNIDGESIVIDAKVGDISYIEWRNSKSNVSYNLLSGGVPGPVGKMNLNLLGLGKNDKSNKLKLIDPSYGQYALKSRRLQPPINNGKLVTKI
jgi:hypothetical protein